MMKTNTAIGLLGYLTVGLGWTSIGMTEEAPPPVPPPASSQKEELKTPPPKEQPPFATINDDIISGETFGQSVRQGMRQTFYHGQVPEGELARFQRETGEKLIIRQLLVQEAHKRGIVVNTDAIKQKIDSFDQRYAQAEEWKKNREKMLASVTPELEKQNIVEQLEQQVRTLPEPSEQNIRAFYDNNPNIFTAPEEIDLSIILLKVEPWAGRAGWDKARDEANELLTKLKNGADFADLARIHSGDAQTAEKGGSMGRLHKGMVAPTVEKTIEKLKDNDISEPVMVLEGVALFRLNKRILSQKQPYDPESQKRAKELLIRERSNHAWEELRTRLRQEGKVTINETQYYLPLPKDPPPKKMPPVKKPAGK